MNTPYRPSNPINPKRGAELFAAQRHDMERSLLRLKLPVVEIIPPIGLALRRGTAYRTKHRQAALYARGRTKPGPIVTWAQPGESAHNFSMAQDYNLFENGRLVTSAEHPAWATLHQAATRHGLTTGLNWPSRHDPGHVQLPYWRQFAGREDD